jgi:hypothetical protein
VLLATNLREGGRRQVRFMLLLPRPHGGSNR